MSREKMNLFHIKIDMCELNEVDEIQSSYGNSYCYITEEQIKALQDGKVLHHDDGEYGIFIILKKESA